MKNEQIPTRVQALKFRAKATLLQIKRISEDLLNRDLRRFSPLPPADLPVIAESISPLWTETEASEQFLQAGKIQNLRRAVKKLNGVTVPANALFSFWMHIGRTTGRKGFVAGRELREGCIIPNIGGGLCQISNALYDAALKANLEIIERHAHTQVVRGSLAERDRDATVFWNYVDLRFRSPVSFQIEAKLDAENLVVRLKCERPEPRKLITISRNNKQAPDEIGSCATCGVNDCYRVIKQNEGLVKFGRTAFLVDEFSPEFDEYIQNVRTERDRLFVPLDGQRFRKSNYAWNMQGFADTRQSLLMTAIRSYKSRKLAQQGALRQKNLLAMSEKLADSYARRLTYDCLHLVVHQNLLPFLWRDGHLGGRTFDVLMTSLPMRSLEDRLDQARSLHPESTTLGDFRAEEWLVESEMRALRQARRIITPHTEIASSFREKAELLDWKTAQRVKRQRSTVIGRKPLVYFPASTVGRKGVYELREALRGLDIRLLISGAILENENFWHGFDVERGNGSNGWAEIVDLVVLPAYVEHKPRRLIEAASLGIPVVASKACGVENVDGIESIEIGDISGLRKRLEQLLPGF